MQLLTKNESLTDAQKAIFLQGASYILAENTLQLGVWVENTPLHESESSIAIGACELAGADAVKFLKDCVSYLKSEHPGRSILGPMNGNTWMKHRLILESDGSLPFLLEPIEPDFMKEVFDEAGFTVLSRYSSSLIDLTATQPDFEKVERIISKQGISIRSLDEDHFVEDLKQIYDLSLSAFSNNFLYTPLPEAAFLNSYQSAREQTDTDLVLLAFKGDELIGFLFCLADTDPQTLIVKTLATKPSQRTTGLGTYLVAMAQQRAKDKGYTKAIHALQFESNSSLRISQRFDAKKFRTYGLMISK